MEHLEKSVEKTAIQIILKKCDTQTFQFKFKAKCNMCFFNINKIIFIFYFWLIKKQ